MTLPADRAAPDTPVSIDSGPNVESGPGRINAEETAAPGGARRASGPLLAQPRDLHEPLHRVGDDLGVGRVTARCQRLGEQ